MLPRIFCKFVPLLLFFAFAPAVVRCGIGWPHDPAIYSSVHALPLWVQHSLSTATDTGQVHLDDIVRFDGDHGQIRATFTLSENLEALAKKEAERGGVVRFVVEQMPGVWTLQFTAGRHSHEPITILTCYDASDPGPFCCFSLTCGNGIADFKAYAFAGPAGRGRFSILLAERPDAVKGSWRLPLDAMPAASVPPQQQGGRQRLNLRSKRTHPLCSNLSRDIPRRGAITVFRCCAGWVRGGCSTVILPSIFTACWTKLSRRRKLPIV